MNPHADRDRSEEPRHEEALTYDERVATYAHAAVGLLGLNVLRAHDRAVAAEIGGKYLALADAELAEKDATIARLEAEVERCKRGAKTLGETIDKQCQMILDITGLHDWIDEDGDGDWGAVWENAYELRPRAEKAEAALARVEAIVTGKAGGFAQAIRAALWGDS